MCKRERKRERDLGCRLRQKFDYPVSFCRGEVPFGFRVEHRACMLIRPTIIGSINTAIFPPVHPVCTPELDLVGSTRHSRDHPVALCRRKAPYDFGVERGTCILIFPIIIGSIHNAIFPPFHPVTTPELDMVGFARDCADQPVTLGRAEVILGLGH